MEANFIGSDWELALVLAARMLIFGEALPEINSHLKKAVQAVADFLREEVPSPVVVLIARV
jgi:hypothetical protein